MSRTRGRSRGRGAGQRGRGAASPAPISSTMPSHATPDQEGAETFDISDTGTSTYSARHFFLDLTFICVESYSNWRQPGQARPSASR